MITAIQTAYKLIFNTTYKITKHIDEKYRNIVIGICMFILVSLFFMQASKSVIGGNHNVLDRTAVGSVAMMIMCVFSVNKPLQNVPWKKWLVYPYYGASMFMVAMSYDHFTGHGFKEYALLLLLVFPAIYFIWENRADYSFYYTMLAKMIILSGLILIILTFVFRPINTETMVGGRYTGISDNSNILGMVGVIITTATLYLISQERKRIPLYIVVNGIATAFIWLCVARTAILVLLFQMIAWIIMNLRINLAKEKIRTIILVVLTLGIMVVSVPICRSTLTTLGKSQAVALAAEEETNIVKERFDLKDKDVMELSSGRAYLWKWYWDRMTIKGNDCTNHEIVTLSGTKLHNAHNTFLEIGYRYGIPAGIFYLIFMASILVINNIAIFNGRKKPFTIFIVMGIIAYFIEALLDVQVQPFTRGPVLIFYLSLVGVFNGDIINKE